jgi:hypothetical protein
LLFENVPSEQPCEYKSIKEYQVTAGDAAASNILMLVMAVRVMYLLVSAVQPSTA